MSFCFSLVCAVSYTTQGGEKMYFRKFFKFQVLNMAEIKLFSNAFCFSGSDYSPSGEQVLIK